MKTRLDCTLRCASATFLVALAISGNATAQSFPKEGRYDYTSCWSGLTHLISFSKSHSAWSFEIMGTNRSNPPGGVFDKETFRCVGTNTLFEGKLVGVSTCDTVDQDGHRRLTHFAPGPDGKVVRSFVAGTGKWDGMVLSGTAVTPLGPFPALKEGTVQNCNHQTGNYKLK